MAATSARASAPALQNPAYRPADPHPDKPCVLNALSARRRARAAARRAEDSGAEKTFG
ncbi:protein of unassigned function [Methylobacterium oryzae CBMB20]|uniref:Protein of unassigned function n=1 Tax=Methylobacterium oryzae CBMB20 TaxID=693986 RepID=A0A089Q7K2_9HYPH|nr:protein of unassigned function [Methylobacterium oryzae CBMB20]